MNKNIFTCFVPPCKIALYYWRPGGCEVFFLRAVHRKVVLYCGTVTASLVVGGLTWGRTVRPAGASGRRRDFGSTSSDSLSARSTRVDGLPSRRLTLDLIEQVKCIQRYLFWTSVLCRGLPDKDELKQNKWIRVIFSKSLQKLMY